MTKAEGLSQAFAEEIAIYLGCKTDELGEAWVDLADAFACTVTAEREMERVACVGVLAYAALKLP